MGAGGVADLLIDWFKPLLTQEEADRYGRTVAEVYKRKGKNIGLRLVKKGFAEVYDKYAYQCDEKKTQKGGEESKTKGEGLMGGH